MAAGFGNADLKVIDGFLDGLNAVVFWLDVEEDGGYRFRKFNTHYADYTGVKVEDLVGKTPQEALPPRQAAAVVSNYDRCRRGGRPIVYEEELELGSGAHWWRTTLTPFADRDDRVHSIVGIAHDITDYKETEFSRREARAQIVALNQDLRMFTSMAVQDMRGPFMTIMGILNFLRDGFVDLGDGKADMLRYCETTAARGMEQMDRILERAQTLDAQEEDLSAVDFHQLSAEIAALVDPRGRLDIEFPEIELATDRVALQLILRVLMENATRHAQERIDVDVSDYGEGKIFVTVFDDGIVDGSECRADGSPILPLDRENKGYAPLEMVRSIVASRDGVLEARRTDLRQGVELCFSLPGQISRSGDLSKVPPSVMAEFRAYGAGAHATN